MQFVENCDECQKNKPANRTEVSGKIPVSGIFNTWSLDYARPPPTTNKGNKFIILGVEHTSRWQVARAIPQSMFNAGRTMKFFENEIIMPFGSLEYILSDKDLKFDFMAMHDFLNKHDINGKYTSKYNPQGNGIAERMFGTLTNLMQRMMRLVEETDPC